MEVRSGFAKVAYGGTGFLMIKRDGHAGGGRRPPRIAGQDGRHGRRRRADRATMIFDTMIEAETGQYLSEDLHAFCRRWRDLGGEIWADMEEPG